MRTIRYITVMVLIGGVSCAVAQDLPFLDSFEDHEVGILHNQAEWRAWQENDVQVQTAVTFGGNKAGLVATNATAWHSFTNSTATNLWVDLYARMTVPTDDTVPTLDGSVAGAFYVNTNGYIVARSNDTWVTFDGAGMPLITNDGWYRFSVHLDYASSNWMLYVAGGTPNALADIVSTNLAFTSASTNAYFKRFRIKN